MASNKATRERVPTPDKQDVMAFLKRNRLFMVPGGDWRDLARCLDMKRLYAATTDADIEACMRREGLAVKGDAS